MNIKITFFANVPDKKFLELMQWYKNDIDILRFFDSNLSIATKLSEISLRSDLYFSWWATGSIFPLIVAMIRKKPIIVVAGGSEVVKSQRLKAGYSSKSWLGKLAVKITMKYANKIIAVSDEIGKEVSAFGRDDVQTVYHGIRTDVYKPSSYKKDIIFTISHLDKANVERKKIKTIIKSIPYVLEKYPDEKFIIAGTKRDAFDELQKLVSILNINNNTYFPGRISEQEKLRYYRRCKIYVQPTVHEAFGVAIAEAMSCGIPVISSFNSAVPEVIGNAGEYVDPNNPKELANKIITILSNNRQQEILGRDARKRIIDNFSFDKRKLILEKLIKGWL